MRIIVLGYIVRGPLAGFFYHHAQYVLGLARLGHDVIFVEDSDDYPSCYNPVTHAVDTDPSHGLRFLADGLDRLGLGDRWAYHDHHAGRWHGPAAGGPDGRSIRPSIASADVLLNLSGVNPLREWSLAVPRRVLIDTDPVFTQVRHLTDPWAMQRARQHNAFFTFGENFGNPERGCDTPDDGLAWRPTRQPICPDLFEHHPAIGDPTGPLTTVMQWDSYPPRRYGRRDFGMKSMMFERFLDLPTRLPGERFAPAIGKAPRDRLAAHGWLVHDPLDATRRLDDYLAFMARSKAEFSIAKHGYVAPRSGWFSERTTCYLATGRPAIVQDTGLAHLYPLGHGVLSFHDPQSAIESVARLNADYPAHCRAARAWVREHFDARRVLSHLLEML